MEYRFGNTSRVETAIEYTYNNDPDTGNGLVITYEVPEEGARGGVPNMGSTTGRMAGVVLNRATVTPGLAGMATVRLEYGKKKDEDEDDDSGSGGGGGGGGDDDDNNEDEDISAWSLEGSVNDAPLLAHPKAQANIDDAQREYLKAVMDGTRLWEKVAELTEKGEPKLDKDGAQVMRPLKQLLKNSLSENGKAVLKLILSGIRSYRSPAATFRETRVITSGELTLSGLGKIGTPTNAPNVDGKRDWLLVGCNFSRTSDMKNRSWTAEYIWELSDEGGWNEQLYKN